jgi:hypothetical protein
MNEIPKVDPELRKAIAREAGDFVEDRVFNLACRSLHAQWYGQLMTDGLPKKQVLDLVSRLRALEAIPARLRSMAKDEELAQRGHHAGGRR